MILAKEVEKFINYVIADEEAENFDKSLPFGGIVSDAPSEVVKAYNEFVEQENKLKAKGIKR